MRGATLAYAPAVLSTRILPRSRTVTLALVVGFAALTAAAAQLRFYLPDNPVPVTGQTFAVLASGAVLGSWAGAASQLLYVGAGALGLPVFADGNRGWEYFTGATFGYLLGFIAAAWLVGYLAERRADRNVVSSLAAFVTGNVVIYVLGVGWLMVSLAWGLEEALVKGLVPFVPGDLFKIGAVSASLPLAWRLLGEKR